MSATRPPWSLSDFLVKPRESTSSCGDNSVCTPHDALLKKATGSSARFASSPRFVGETTGGKGSGCFRSASKPTSAPRAALNSLSRSSTRRCNSSCFQGLDDGVVVAGRSVSLLSMLGITCPPLVLLGVEAPTPMFHFCIRVACTSLRSCARTSVCIRVLICASTLASAPKSLAVSRALVYPGVSTVCGLRNCALLTGVALQLRPFEVALARPHCVAATLEGSKGCSLGRALMAGLSMSSLSVAVVGKNRGQELFSSP
mmetsp:Transcript_25211/g.70285  ORF Transcript_25211/g.70285 Transcript_25211/m.70285 type:complete len:258 (+) Transcript_25211:652-1425(+)